MIRNRCLALLTALCLLFSVLPIHTHAAEADHLAPLYHNRHQWEATHQVQTDDRGQRLVSHKNQGVLPSSGNDFIVSNTFGANCQWGIGEDGFLYIWCDGEMPRREAGQYPWSAYTNLFSAVYVASGTLADNAFADCANLKVAIIEDGVSAIGQNAFARCSGLEEFWFYGAAPSIAQNAFSGTRTYVIYHYEDPSFAELDGQNFGGELTWHVWVDTLDGGMFGTVEWIVYEDMSMRLEGAYGAMDDMSSGEGYPWHVWSDQITYLSCYGITHLGNYALENFTALEFATFDSTLITLGSGAFRGCSNFTLSFKGNAPSLGTEVFTSNNFSLDYPSGNPTWTQEIIDRFYGREPGVDTPPTHDPEGVTCGTPAQQIYDVMIALKAQYPEGMRWTNDDYYAWNGGDFSGGYGCAGFAFILSDAAFGHLPSRRITENITIDDIRVGDILRINNDTHSVIVLEVFEDHVVVAEGNYNSSIHWGRTFTAEKIASVTDYIMTRYPEHNWSTGTCLEPHVCLACGLEAEAPGHSWLAASCTAPKTCRDCGFTEGEPAGHMYDNDADSFCNVCGFHRDIGSDSFDDETIPLSAFELEALRLTNLERLAHGLTPLTATALLQKATDIRANEVKSYFDHTRPNGTSWFTVLQELGVPYKSAAENIAFGYPSPAEVVTGWMESEGHRKNILTPTLGHMGVGEEDLSWVQLFTDAPKYTSIRVDVPDNVSILPGTSIDDMGLVAVLHNKNGDCWLPLSAAFCSGYDPNVGGTQTVTVTVLGVSCTFTLNLGGHAHNWEKATCETPKTCSECGKTKGGPLGHNWMDATCEAAKSCDRCGKSEGTALGHSWVDATCETVKTCVRCGKTEGTPLGHSWINATCETAKTCSRCSKNEGTALGHDWNSASCEVPGICNRCGISNGNALGHSWVDATCDKPKTCPNCGKTEGNPLGHSWAEASCEAPKTCSVCGQTEGSPLGHNWVAASCETPDTCSRCGASTGTALGHNWQAATCQKPKTCLTCGKAEGTTADHNWDAGIITRNPTFGTDGELTFTCQSCSLTRTEPIMAPFVKIDKPDTVASKYNFSYAIPEDGATVLIFFSPLCLNSQHLMQSLNNCLWLDNPWLNVVAVDCYSGNGSNLEAFRNTYTPDAGDQIQYLYAQSNSIAFDYYRMMGGGNSLTWPLVMVVTGSADAPVVRFGGIAMTDFRKLEEALDYVSPAFAGWDGTVHEHTWLPATCQAPKTCSECGQTEGTTIDHSWKSATCLAPQTCSECGTVEGDPLPHIWEPADCHSPSTCASCGQTQGEPLGHDWKEATCQSLKFCTRCSQTEGSLAPHNFRDGYCTVCLIQQQMPGDTDGNGKVTYNDALKVLRASINLEPLSNEIRQACDVDGNGRLDYNDALLILRYSINLITEFPKKN